MISSVRFSVGFKKKDTVVDFLVYDILGHHIVSRMTYRESRHFPDYTDKYVYVRSIYVYVNVNVNVNQQDQWKYGEVKRDDAIITTGLKHPAPRSIMCISAGRVLQREQSSRCFPPENGAERSYGTDDVRHGRSFIFLFCCSLLLILPTRAKRSSLSIALHWVNIHGATVRSPARGLVSVPKMSAGNPKEACGKSWKRSRSQERYQVIRSLLMHCSLCLK